MKKRYLFFASLAIAVSFNSCEQDEKLSQKSEIINKVTAQGGETFTDESGQEFNAIQSDEEPSNGEMPITRITYTEPKADLGEVEEGIKVQHSFEFKNTGHEPLILQSVQGSCGCTVPSYSREPIAPGETGQIDIEFDSKGRPGINTKDVTIVANTNPSITKVSFTVKVNDK